MFGSYFLKLFLRTVFETQKKKHGFGILFLVFFIFFVLFVTKNLEIKRVLSLSFLIFLVFDNKKTVT